MNAKAARAKTNTPAAAKSIINPPFSVLDSIRRQFHKLAETDIVLGSSDFSG
jgi:hypothetical protein